MYTRLLPMGGVNGHYVDPLWQDTPCRFFRCSLESPVPARPSIDCRVYLYPFSSEGSASPQDYRMRARVRSRVFIFYGGDIR